LFYFAKHFVTFRNFEKMVRIAVAFALVAAAEGARSNLKDVELATEEADATLDDADFDYEVADGLDWDEDEELAAGDFNFEEGWALLQEFVDAELDAEANETQIGSWQCVPGQGGAGQSFQQMPYNNMQACSRACAYSHQCDAFDFTTWNNRDSCRFYRAGNRARHNNPGIHNRQYCFHTQHWLNLRID